MADQMTPDELRIAAEDVDNWIDSTGNAHVAAQAARNLADVIEYAHAVDYEAQLADSKWRAGQGSGRVQDGRDVALGILRIARGETNERETPCD